jgi:hypothetical protein
MTKKERKKDININNARTQNFENFENSETDESIRYDENISAFLDQVVERWNKIEHAVPFVCLVKPEITRFSFLKRFNEFGKEGMLSAIENVEKSEFYKAKSSNKIDFNKFLEPKIFNGFIAGRYESDYDRTRKSSTKKQYEPTGFNTAPAQEYYRNNAATQNEEYDRFVEEAGI